MISTIFHLLPHLLTQLAVDEEDAPAAEQAPQEDFPDAFVPAQDAVEAKSQLVQGKILPEMNQVALTNLTEVLDPQKGLWLFVGTREELDRQVQSGKLKIPTDRTLYFLDSKKQPSLATILLRKLNAEKKSGGAFFLLNPKTPNEKSFHAFQELSLQHLNQFYTHLEEDGLLLFVGSDTQLKKAIKNGNVGVAEHYYRLDPKQQSSLFALVSKRLGLSSGTPKIHRLEARELELPRRFKPFGLADLPLLREQSDEQVVLYVGNTDTLTIYEAQIFDRSPAKTRFYFLNFNEQSSLTHILETQYKDVFPQFDAKRPSQYIKFPKGKWFTQVTLGSAMPLARQYAGELRDEMLTPQIGTTSVILLVNGVESDSLSNALAFLQHNFLRKYPDQQYYIVDSKREKKLTQDLASLHSLRHLPKKGQGLVLVRHNQGGATGIVVPETTNLRGKTFDEMELEERNNLESVPLTTKTLKAALDQGEQFVVVRDSHHLNDVLFTLKPEDATKVSYLVLDKAGRRVAAKFNLPDLPPAARAALIQKRHDGLHIQKSIAIPDAQMVKQHTLQADTNGYFHMDLAALKTFLQKEKQRNRGETQSPHHLFFGDASSQRYVEMVEKNRDEFAFYGQTGERKYIWFHGTKAELEALDSSFKAPTSSSYQLSLQIVSGEWKIMPYEPFRFVSVRSFADAQKYIHSGNAIPSLVLVGNKASLNARKTHAFFNVLIERFHKTGESIKPVIALMENDFVQRVYAQSSTDKWKSFADSVKQAKGELRGYWFVRENYTEQSYSPAELIAERDLGKGESQAASRIPSVPASLLPLSETARKNIEFLDEEGIEISTVITAKKDIGKMIFISGDLKEERVHALLERLAERKEKSKSAIHIFFYNGDFSESRVAEYFTLKDPLDSDQLVRMKKGFQVMKCTPSKNPEYWECIYPDAED